MSEFDFLSDIVRQWRDGGVVASPNALRDFVLQRGEPAAEDRARLAVALVAVDFRLQREQGAFISVEAQRRIYLKLFADADLMLDERRLTCELIAAEIETSRATPDLAALLERFPECEDFVVAVLTRDGEQNGGPNGNEQNGEQNGGPNGNEQNGEQNGGPNGNEQNGEQNDGPNGNEQNGEASGDRNGAQGDSKNVAKKSPRKNQFSSVFLDPGAETGALAGAFLDEEENVLRSQGEAPRLSEGYEIVAPLGCGGQKNVYQAKQQSTSQMLAFKELRRNGDKRSRKAMIREASLQANISHPNVPMVLSLCADENGSPVFVERLITGRDWAEAMDELSLEKNLEILIAVSRTLAFVHERRRVVHRDVKPENVMLGEQDGRFNEIYLVDWGLAVEYESVDPFEIEPGGTIAYMPPESLVCDGEFARISPATDVFMLGAVGYRILAGRAPYEYDEKRDALLRRVASTDFEPLPETRPSSGPTVAEEKIPDELREIVLKALAQNPQDRYANAGEFADALTLFQKRSGLIDRLDAARLPLGALLAAEKPSTTELVEIANELRLVRELAIESDETSNAGDGDAPLSTLGRDALKMEETARNLLLETLLATKDFGLVESQIAVARKQATFFERFESPEENAARGRRLDAFAARLQRGLAARRRERFLKIALGVFGGILVGLVCWNADLQRKNAEERERHVVQENRERAEHQSKELEQYIVESDRYGQAKLAYLAQMNKYRPNDPKTLGRLEEAAATTLLPEETSAFRDIVDAVAFSTDGTRFATLSGSKTLTVWNAETFAAESRQRICVEPDAVGEYGVFLEANPLFGCESAPENLKNSRFILQTTFGLTQIFDDALTTVQEFNVFDVNDLPSDARDATSRPAIFAPSKNELAAVAPGKNGDVCVFSLNDGKLIRSFKTGKSALKALAVSEDGRELATVAEDGAIQCWTLDGKPLKTLNFRLKSASAADASSDSNGNANFGAGASATTGGAWRRCAFSPSGKRIVAGSEDGEIVVWDLAADKELARVDAEKTAARTAPEFFWFDENRFAVLRVDGAYQTFDLTETNGNETLRSATASDAADDAFALAGGPRAAAFSRSAKRMIVVGNDRSFQAFDVENGAKIASSEGLARSERPFATVSNAVYFGAVDRILIGADDYRSLCSFDPNAMRPDRYFAPYPAAETTRDEIERGAFCPSSVSCPDIGTEFAVAFFSGDAMIFDANDSAPKRVLKAVGKRKSPSDVARDSADFPIVAASPKGETLAVGNVEKDEIVLFDWKTGEEIRRIDRSSGWNGKDSTSKPAIVGMFFLDETSIFEALRDGTMNVWNVETGELTQHKNGAPHLAWLSRCQPSRDRSQAALGFCSGRVLLIDLATLKSEFSSDLFCLPPPNYRREHPVARRLVGARTAPPSNPNAVVDFAWSRDDSIFVVSFANGKTAAIKTKSRTLFAACSSGEKANDELAGGAFFTKNDKIVTLGADGVLTRWDYRPTDVAARVLNGETGVDSLAAASEPGRWASVDDRFGRGTFRVFDGAKERFRTDGVAEFARFEPSSDARRFILARQDGTLAVVDQASGAPVERSPIVFAKDAPKNGFLRIDVSADNRWVVAIERPENSAFAADESSAPKGGGAIYLLDLKESAPIWRKLAATDAEDERFVRTAVSPDSRYLVAAVAGSPNRLRVWDLETRRERLNPGRVLLTGPEISGERGRIRFLSDRFLAQTGIGDEIVVWDVRKMERFQTTKLNRLDRDCEARSVDGVAALPNGFGLAEDGEKDAPAFVVAGTDGALRFYRLVEKSDENGNVRESEFATIFVASATTLADMIAEPGKERDGDDGNLIRSPKRIVVDIDASSDGKTLYVGTRGETRAYDLDEIERKIVAAPEKWSSIDERKKTGLVYRLGEGLFPHVRNYMRQE